jgi:hypothetical protein
MAESPSKKIKTSDNSPNSVAEGAANIWNVNGGKEEAETGQTRAHINKSTNNERNGCGSKALEMANDRVEAIQCDAVGLMEAPCLQGIVIRLNHDSDKSENGNGNNVSIDFSQDQHFPMIHPNCYAPANLRNVHLLKGGGSGTAVFRGDHPDYLEGVVMKHGNAKDTGEVLSLAAIQQELARRGGAKAGQLLETQVSAAAAAVFLRHRIPEFLFVYISPFHVRNRGVELWRSFQRRVLALIGLKCFSSAGSFNCVSSTSLSSFTSKNGTASSSSSLNNTDSTATEDNENKASSCEEKVKTGISATPKIKLDPVVCRGLAVGQSAETGQWQFLVSPHHVQINVPGWDEDDEGSNDVIGGADAIFPSLSHVMAKCQTKYHWKFTLGQKRIGGPQTENAALVLTSGRLVGELLLTLQKEFTQVMHALQKLTSNEEMCGNLASLREEVDALRQAGTSNLSMSVKQAVSKSLNAFVGGAIYKNYDPEVGRLRQLRVLGGAFRRYHQYHPQTAGKMAMRAGPIGAMNGANGGDDKQGKLPDDQTDLPAMHFEESEMVPSLVLGKMLERGVNLPDIYARAPSFQSALDALDAQNKWMELLELALSFGDISDSNQRNACSECVWSSGLTDAGLHNCFLSETSGLQLFDLGEPAVMSLPAFLTKFLMSFFHAFGMEDDPTSGSDCWINRFALVDEVGPEHEERKDGNENGGERKKLTLNPSTRRMIPYIYGAFTDTTDYFIQHVFAGETRMRGLLVRYVVLQLLSDASFCLGKWQKKGGGCRIRERSGLEKWLWRGLWDLYIASHVSSTLLMLSSPSSQNEVEKNNREPTLDVRWMRIRDGTFFQSVE